MKLMSRRRRRAFTLIEVLVALSLLSLAIFGLMAAFGNSAALRSTSRQSEFIQRQARAYINGLRSQATVNLVRTAITSDPTWIDTGEQTEGTTSGNVALQVGVDVISSNVRIMTEAECAAAYSGHSFDLDRDGTHNEAGAASDVNAYSTVIPIEMTVTWRDPQNPTQTRSLTLRTLIYPAGSITQA